MQSDKASKKMNKNANEPVQPASAEVSATAEKTAKPRISKSSKSKSEPVETASAKRHRRPASASAPEPAVAEPVAAPQTMAAAVGGASTASVVIDPVGVDIPAISSTKPSASYERIQELAYQYWVADGRRHGKHHEHWLRAEREIERVP
jgi:hypothetical protein